MSSESFQKIDFANEIRVIKANKLHRISTIALILGILIGINIPLLFTFITRLNIFKYKQLPLYLISLFLFHFLEYFITAKYSYDKVSEESFLINNGYEYHIAHIVSLLEFVIESYFFPNMKLLSLSSILSYKPLISLTGLLLLLVGQTIRSLAMIKAGESFSHLIAINKKQNHKLVTDGIYSFSRHPSYAGFFWWGIGTQLMLLNPISLLGFAYVLFNFFNRRIRFEEAKLIEFFGNDYVVYKSNVSTKIPFIP